jgi:hypothetical protein
MNDMEKQVVYKQIEAGRRSIKELTGKEIKELKEHWFSDKYVEMPPVPFHYKLCEEERRREAATKPMRMRDKDFYK